MSTNPVALLRDLRPTDAARVDELFPAQRRVELLQAITGAAAPGSSQPNVAPAGTPRRWWAVGARRWSREGRASVPLRRPRVLYGLAAALTAALVAVALSTTSAVNPPPAQAVQFRAAENGDIIATVTEPFAAQAQLNAAFAKQGLKITVNLLPVSPSIVGTVLYVGESGGGAQIKPLQGGHCLTGGGGCAIGIEIPRDFTGEGGITLGRPAKPGEAYESAASIFAPGEPLHCSGLLGAKVAAALPALEADHLNVVQWREDTESSPGVSRSSTNAQPPMQNYIWGAELVEPGKVRVTTEGAPWPDYPGAGSDYDKGC